MAYAPVKMKEARNSTAPFFVELYVLELRTGVTYIAACDEDIEYDGDIYIAVPFSRDDIVRSADNLFDETSIRLGDVDDTKLAYILSGFDFRGCRVGIMRIQYPDSLKDPRIVLPVFVGYLDSPSYGDNVFSCRLKSMFPMIKAPRRAYQIQCNSNFGDVNCGLNLSQKESVVKAVSGNKIYLQDSYAADFFRYGIAAIKGETRNVLASGGNCITVGMNFMQDNIVGKKIRLERGCDKTKECCRAMGNLKHFSGFPAIPFESVYR